VDISHSSFFRADLLDDPAREVYDVEKDAIIRIRFAVACNEERPSVTGGMSGDELRVGEKRFPRLTDNTEAAELLGRKADQDLIERVDR
jgi:hypothetical protein